MKWWKSHQDSSYKELGDATHHFSSRLSYLAWLAMEVFTAKG